MNKFLIILIIFLFSPLCMAEIVQDETADLLERNQPFPEAYTNYNFESTLKIPINLKILNEIKSETDLCEGEKIKFRVQKNVLYNGNVMIRRGTPVEARVSVIITPGMNGIPAGIILRDFDIEGVSKGKLMNEYEIYGQDRSLLVFPLKWALTILPPTGSLTNFIMGGHAKIKKRKIITIDYYPEWI